MRLSACRYCTQESVANSAAHSDNPVAPCRLAFTQPISCFNIGHRGSDEEVIYTLSRPVAILLGLVIAKYPIIMAYTVPLLASKRLRPVDIFTPYWRLLSLAGACYSYFKYLPPWWILLILFKLLWRSRGIRTFITINQKISPKLSWLLYLCAVPLDDFETDFRQAWIEQLDSFRTGEDEVLMVNIFVGKESIPVPVLFNWVDVTKNRDAQTFTQLRMWYFWMQYKKGLAELVLPRQLMYIERIKVSTSRSQDQRCTGF